MELRGTRVRVTILPEPTAWIDSGLARQSSSHFSSPVVADCKID